MTAKCSCQHCNGHIEFDPDQAGQTIACPHCGLETALFVPSTPARAVPSKQTPIIDEASLANFERLSKGPTSRKELRNQTAYSNERTIVNWACGLTTVAAAYCVVGLIATGGGENGALAFFSIMACLLIAWIGRGVAHAVFDIADCALARHRNSG
jgi:hypothetical protein